MFEQAAVNFSEVFGELPAEMTKRLLGEEEEEQFFATGVSVVIHPLSPFIPSVHCNFRYLEVKDKKWFGGGSDLTPYYLFEEDAVHFHSVFKKALDSFDTSFYPQFKRQCDEYFFLPHREEARGIGGIFYDYLGKEDEDKLPYYLELSSALCPCFLRAYLPIVEKRKSELWTEQEREFQLIRRGRYVEFNLLCDRGTAFGLKTRGRSESILSSLPPLVRWENNFTPQAGSPEEKLINTLKQPKNWL